jgi:hypothetical protein
MLRTFQNFFWLALLAAGLQTSWGFAWLGPLANAGDKWQSPVIGYGLAYVDFGFPGGPIYLGDIGGPKNITEEYHRNVPFTYYSYDATYLEYFGSNGVAVVDSAMGMMNSLTNADKLDPNTFPFMSQHFNPTAMALYLTDLRSATLHCLIEQMGLAQPERFTWTLHDRVVPPGCPLTTSYLLVQRNYGINNITLNQLQYSPYVNNILFTYFIVENCTGPNPLAYTVPFSVDPLAKEYAAVAANNGDSFGGLQLGGFYTGLTYDDAAGLRVLYSTNNVNREAASAGSLMFAAVTNFNAPQALFPPLGGSNNVSSNSLSGYGTYDYRGFVEAASTNDPATMQALYPGLVVTSSHDYWILATNKTVTAGYAPAAYGSPYGSPPRLVYTTNITRYPLHKYVTTFANVITNYYQPNTKALLQTITTTQWLASPYGSSPATNTTTLPITFKNKPSGSFYILPLLGTNRCPVDILYTLQQSVVYTTNTLTVANTNVVTATNTTSFTFTQNLITWYTNFIYVTLPVTCAQTNGPAGLYQGIGGVKFIRADYDSLVGQFWQPVTNSYSMVSVNNGQLNTLHFDRVIVAPEILLTSSDQGLPNTGNYTVTRTTPNFDQSQILNGLAGPGVIQPGAIFDYNRIGPAYDNGYFVQYPFLRSDIPTLLDETTQIPASAWASFDDSTNPPVIYPDGNSLDNLNNQLLTQISPLSLPNGTNDIPYGPILFNVVSSTHFVAPYTWSAGGLPPGLTMAPDGTFSGTPIRQAPSPLVYDIVVILTDSQSNTAQWSYPIVIQ